MFGESRENWKLSMGLLVFQITALSCRLVNVETKKLVSEWRSPSGKNISVANCNGSQIVCATGKEVFLIEINSGDLKQVR